MKFNPKHRKLFYVPGMISLVLIPVLCLWYINSHRYLKKDYCVGLSIADVITDNASDLNSEHTFPKLGYVPKRCYKTFVFDGNNDEQKLKDLVAPLKGMIKRNDTVVGLKFSFGKHAKYETFIAALDLLFINKANYYLVYKDDIYIAEHAIRRQKLIPISPIAVCRVDNTYWLEQEKIRQQEFLIKSMKKFWQIPLTFLGIMLLNLYMLIKFNKNRNYNQKSYI